MTIPSSRGPEAVLKSPDMVKAADARSPLISWKVRTTRFPICILSLSASLTPSRIGFLTSESRYSPSIKFSWKVVVVRSFSGSTPRIDTPEVVSGDWIMPSTSVLAAAPFTLGSLRR